MLSPLNSTPLPSPQLTLQIAHGSAVGGGRPITNENVAGALRSRSSRRRNDERRCGDDAGGDMPDAWPGALPVAGVVGVVMPPRSSGRRSRGADTGCHRGGLGRSERRLCLTVLIGVHDRIGQRTSRSCKAHGNAVERIPVDVDH